jgi:hypothetical protein
MTVGTAGAATVTANGFAATWDGTSYSYSPAAGKGQLIINVDGDVVVGSQGTIHMNSGGYAGATQGNDGYSINGPGTDGAGRAHSDSGYRGGGGSYATLGSSGESDRMGSVYGASDFWTQLYLGSGAAGAPCGGSGGAGGGAIKITAANLINSGTISSIGGDGNTCWSGWSKGGSGGTLFFNISGIVSNTGTFSVRGGAQNNNGQGGLGRIGVINGEGFDNRGTSYPEITCDGTGDEPDCLN